MDNVVLASATRSYSPDKGERKHDLATPRRYLINAGNDRSCQGQEYMAFDKFGTFVQVPCVGFLKRQYLGPY